MNSDCKENWNSSNGHKKVGRNVFSDALSGLRFYVDWRYLSTEYFKSQIKERQGIRGNSWCLRFLEGSLRQSRSLLERQLGKVHEGRHALGLGISLCEKFFLSQGRGEIEADILNIRRWTLTSWSYFCLLEIKLGIFWMIPMCAHNCL